MTCLCCDMKVHLSLLGPLQWVLRCLLFTFLQLPLHLNIPLIVCAVKMRKTRSSNYMIFFYPLLLARHHVLDRRAQRRHPFVEAPVGLRLNASFPGAHPIVLEDPGCSVPSSLSVNSSGLKRRNPIFRLPSCSQISFIFFFSPSTQYPRVWCASSSGMRCWQSRRRCWRRRRSCSRRS